MLPTSKQQPEGSSPDFAFNEVEPLIGRFFMHPQGHSDVTGLTKCSMLRRIIPLAEVIDTVTKWRSEGMDVEPAFAHKSANTHK